MANPKLRLRQVFVLNGYNAPECLGWLSPLAGLSGQGWPNYIKIKHHKRGARLRLIPVISGSCARSALIASCGSNADRQASLAWASPAEKEQGFNAAKKVIGRKRHILVDTLGLLLNVVVHSAAMQDRDGALLVLDLRTASTGHTIETRRPPSVEGISSRTVSLRRNTLTSTLD